MAEVSLGTVLQALSDPCRLAIVQSLLREDVVELACNEVPLKIAKATRSHHFDVLRQAGLIQTRTEGTKCLSSLRREELDARFPGLLELVAREAPAGGGKDPCCEESAVAV
jgi:DNA-binding transcriptional ArsR family regulator